MSARDAHAKVAILICYRILQLELLHSEELKCLVNYLPNSNYLDQKADEKNN